jgi:hypothetical protein
LILLELGTLISSLLQDVPSNTSSDGQTSGTILLVDVQHGWDVSSNSPPLDEQVSNIIFQQMGSSVATFFQVSIDEQFNDHRSLGEEQQS